MKGYERYFERVGPQCRSWMRGGFNHDLPPPNAVAMMNTVIANNGFLSKLRSKGFGL